MSRGRSKLCSKTIREGQFITYRISILCCMIFSTHSPNEMNLQQKHNIQKKTKGEVWTKRTFDITETKQNEQNYVRRERENTEKKFKQNIL